MGGKNPCIVTEHADLDRAADRHRPLGLSAWAGRSARRCRGCTSTERVADELIERIEKQMDAIRIGDPRLRENWLGPVVNANAYRNYARYVDELGAQGATLRRGGGSCVRTAAHRVTTSSRCSPRRRPRIRCGSTEMFLPILMVHRYADRDEAMRLANDTDLGLTAGIYGSDDRRRAGSTTTSRPASPTPTARRVRRPARGRATSHSVDGRARARPARRSPPSTTCRSTCASSRARSSNEPWSSCRSRRRCRDSCPTARRSRSRASRT